MIPDNEPIQFACSSCLRMRYVGNLTDEMEDGILKAHRWRPGFSGTGRKTKRSFCGKIFIYGFYRIHLDQ